MVYGLVDHPPQERRLCLLHCFLKLEEYVCLVLFTCTPNVVILFVNVIWVSRFIFLSNVSLQMASSEIVVQFVGSNCHGIWHLHQPKDTKPRHVFSVIRPLGKWRIGYLCDAWGLFVFNEQRPVLRGVRWLSYLHWTVSLVFISPTHWQLIFSLAHQLWN